MKADADGAFVFEDDAKPIEAQKPRIKCRLGELWANATQLDNLFVVVRQF